MADLVQPDTPASEGRVNLLGAWKLEDPQAIPSPTLQRVIGQVEQWAAAGAGLQPKATERAEGSKAGQDAVAGMSAAQGSGTRLTENAVRETQQAQDAQWEAQADVPVEDMRFWLQGKQQRAEVVLDQAQLDHIRRIWEPEPWADGDRRLHLRVRVRHLTGRRVGELPRARASLTDGPGSWGHLDVDWGSFGPAR